MTLPAPVKKFMWDVDQQELSLTAHRAFIISRLTEKGDWRAVQWLKKQYGVSAIKQIVAHSKNTSRRTKNFWQIA
ncbi:MAG: hypothetical protein HYV42_05065 [Candidatus Magasanikbacteria bacterium]|nr:hypothetical protein [Candidatus Magasanikbacteria bacterium]